MMQVLCRRGSKAKSGLFLRVYRLSRAAALVVVLGLVSLAQLRADRLDVVISELHYHPAGSGSEEFLELQNLSDDAVDLSRWILTGGITFLFPEGTALRPGGQLVVAENAALLRAVYDLPAAVVTGDYFGKLSNGGEVVTLRDAAGRLVDRVAYRDEDPWPANPDGLGPSLERVDLRADGEQQWVWRSSIFPGGTPAARNSTWEERVSQAVIRVGDDWRYFKGTDEPSSPIGAWVELEFDDEAWPVGPSGFGYGDGDDATELSDMEDNYTTVYIRRTFTLADPAQVESLLLSVVYDDAFVAYLNGHEVWRSASAGGTPGTPLAHDAVADASHGAGDGADAIDLSRSTHLRSGTNVLAIQGINASLGSSDLSLIPTLTLSELRTSGLVEAAHDLEINEVMAGGADRGFIEIYNEGERAQDLSGYRLVSHPVALGAYVVPNGVSLEPGELLAVTGSELPFSLVDGEQWFGLLTPDGRFVDGVETRLRPAGRAWGRWPDGDGDTFVLDAPTPGAPNELTLEQRVVVTEIRYHPPLGHEGEEYVEIHNRSASPVNLEGWSLRKGVSYSFLLGTTLPAGGYLVVARDPVAVEARYGITGVLGPWSGRLSNSDEKVEIADALGNRVDVVHYADEGLWPSSTLSSGPDGLGSSIELLHPGMENNNGVAWADSEGDGTPGLTNSRTDANPAPVIRSVNHSPAQPRSGEPVIVTARVFDESGVPSVSVYYRLDSGGSYQSITMLDDGLHGDGLAGDRRFGATLPAQNEGAIVRFYIRARDAESQLRTYPATAPTPTLLYQVDDSAYPVGLPLYRIVMREADFDELTSRDLDSDVLLDATFIRGKDIHYNVGLRYRGEHSREAAVKSFRVQFSHDQRFEEIKRLNLLAVDPQLSHLAADFLRRSDVPTFQSRVVAVTLNRRYGGAHGGIYARAEAVDGDFLERAFPGDDGGNLYRAMDPSGSAEGDLVYRGPDPDDYVDSYDKRTNEEVGDYSDIIYLTDVLTNASDEGFLEEISAIIDVEEWQRFFAAEMVLSNQDGAIATNSGEDYFLYHRLSDDRFVILPWDQNENFESPGGGLYRMSSPSVQRLIRHPLLVKRYLEIVHELLSWPLAPDQMTPRIDALRPFFSSALLDDVAGFVSEQQTALGALFPHRIVAGIAPRRFVSSGDVFRFFRGTREPSGGTTEWTTRSFNDEGWEEGPSGFGYGDGDDRTVLADMEGNYTTVYIRRRFDVADRAAVRQLVLSVRYDDGFVAYLNGTEIARQNVSGRVAFDERSTVDHEAGQARDIDVSDFRDLLLATGNVLALVGVNSSINSSDLSLDPELVAGTAGLGCSGLVVVQSSPFTLEGTAPIFETERLEVDGEPAAYDPTTGRWRLELTQDPGMDRFLVRALDRFGAEIDQLEGDLVVTGGVTEVSGPAGNRWTAAASPYHVVGDVTVADGSTLVIEPGVVALLDSGVSLIVAGTLDVQGTEGAPVLFESATCGGPWGSITLQGAPARGLLRGVHLSGCAGAALRVESGAELVLEASTISAVAGVGVESWGAASRVTIRDSLVEDCAGGVWADTSFVEMERSHVRDVAAGSSAVTLIGESTPQSLIRECLFEESRDNGVELIGASARVEGCRIRRMADMGISLAGPSSPSILSTLIHDCSEGIAVKDGVEAQVSRTTVSNTSVALHSYRWSVEAGTLGGDSLIVWGNDVSVLVEDEGRVQLDYSDVEGGYPGDANGSFDPRFVDPASRDYHLRQDSPAAGAGKDGVDMGAFPLEGPPAPLFVRGDANEDEVVDISDPIAILLHLFAGGRTPRCLDVVDADDSGVEDISDAIYLLGFLFLNGPPPPAPFPTRGEDPTPTDPLECDGG